MSQTPSNTTGSFDQLLPGDLFVATDSDGKTYKVPYSRVSDIIEPLPPVVHIKNIKSGSVQVSDHDYITDLNGNLVSGTSFTGGEYLVYGDTAIFMGSTGTWDFGPLSDTRKRKSFYQFVRGCASFNGDVSHISVDSAEDISYMFAECTVFNRPVSNFNTSKVNTMRALFRQCKAFNQDVNHFNTSACENFQIVFQGCDAFRGALSNWDVDHGVTFHQMFAATRYTPDLSSWDLERAVTLEGMFQNSYFNGDISGWNTSNVSRMDAMFNGNTRFSQNLSQWCVSKIPTAPFKFAPALTGSYHPKWGTCPRGEDQV